MDKFPNYRRSIHNVICRNAELEVMGDELNMVNFIREGNSKEIERIFIGEYSDGTRHWKDYQVGPNVVYRDFIMPKYWKLRFLYGPFVFMFRCIYEVIRFIAERLL